MNGTPLTKSEAFVFDLCQKSALSLWSYNNPKTDDPRKELCDILVVCEPDIIIFSVKDITLKESTNPTVDIERWERKAVTSSIKQIFGAERWLSTATNVIRHDGSSGLKLPPLHDRKIHRIAVAFGGQDKVPISSGVDDKGYVHVMNERSFYEVVNELDTITDLVAYLAAKEQCAARNCAIVIDGSESNLVGWYLHHGRTFPEAADFIMVGDDIWREVTEKPEFKRRKEADRDSYYWDRLIELLADPSAKGVSEPVCELTNVEKALRVMARECRFARRELGKGMYEFIAQAKEKKLRSRMMIGFSGVIYVFVFFPKGEPDEARMAELQARCLIARQRAGKGDTIVGIGISEHDPSKGSASDLLYMRLTEWSPDYDREAEKLKQELGFFKAPLVQRRHAVEYPNG